MLESFISVFLFLNAYFNYLYCFFILLIIIICLVINFSCLRRFLFIHVYIFFICFYFYHWLSVGSKIDEMSSILYWFFILIGFFRDYIDFKHCKHEFYRTFISLYNILFVFNHIKTSIINPSLVYFIFNKINLILIMFY